MATKSETTEKKKKTSRTSAKKSGTTARTTAKTKARSAPKRKPAPEAEPPADTATPVEAAPRPPITEPDSSGLLPGVTVVIPAKNEEPSIGEIIDNCRPYCDEVLVVDGHSKDRTVEVANEHNARVVQDNKLGKGDALRVGAFAAGRQVCVFIDADGSHDPADIPKLTGPIIAGQADLVIGSRGKGGSDELHGDIEKLMRLVGSDLILIGINLRWKTNLTDSQNGFRAIRTEVMRSIKTTEKITTIEQEMTMKVLKNGFRVTEAPTHEYERKYGESTIKLRKVWFRYIYSFLKNLI